MKIATKLNHEVKSIGDGRATIQWSGTPTIPNKKAEASRSSAEGTSVLSLDDGFALNGTAEFEVAVSYKKWFRVLNQNLWCKYEIVRVEER